MSLYCFNAASRRLIWLSRTADRSSFFFELRIGSLTASISLRICLAVRSAPRTGETTATDPHSTIDIHTHLRTTSFTVSPSQISRVFDRPVTDTTLLAHGDVGSRVRLGVDGTNGRSLAAADGAGGAVLLLEQRGDHLLELAAGLDRVEVALVSTTNIAGIALMPHDAENSLSQPLP